jgi:uncharacterized protein YndB with AHSA1/START domain
MPGPAEQSAPAASDLALAITRTLDAPREAVFAAWTDPAQFTRWMGPGDVHVEVTALDAREGGQYRILMHGIPGGGHHAVRGTYRVVEPPSRLVFTWAWEQDAATKQLGHESLVTVTLRPVGSRTELTLRHEKFDSAASRDSHNGGWEGVFPKLEKFLKEGRA